MSKITEQAILNALMNIRYPGEEDNIVSSGMVQDDIRIDGNKVSFSIRFKKAKDPFYKSVIRASEAILLNEVDSQMDIKGNIQPLFPKLPKVRDDGRLLPNVRNIVAIHSGKGGVGKSTITANLAVALAQCGYSVGLLDADIYGPSMPRMFHLEEARPTLVEVDGKEFIDPPIKYGVKILSIGFFVNKDDAIVWRGTMASNAMGQLIREGNWGSLDYLLIDLPPGTSDIHLSLIQMLGLTGAVVVTTPQNVATDDAIKGINMFRDEKINVPILGIIENMSWFTPAELPQNRYYIFGKDGGMELAKSMGVSLLGQVPLVQSVREGADEGTPIALRDDAIMGLAFRNVANNLVAAIDKRNLDLPPTKKVEVNK